MAAATAATAIAVLTPAGAALADVVAPSVAPVTSSQISALANTAAPSLRLPPGADGVLAPAPPIDTRFVVTGPALTSSQLATARAVVASDATLKTVLAGTTYTVTEDTPWTDAGSDVVIGDDLTLTLSAPLAGTFTLPAIHYDEAGVSFVPVKLHESIANSATLKIAVSLQATSIVSIQPDDNATVTDAGGNTTFPLTSANGN